MGQGGAPHTTVCTLAHTPLVVGAPQVGFMAATSLVNVQLLQESFDLAAFDGLMPPDVFDVQETSARLMAARRVRRGRPECCCTCVQAEGLQQEPTPHSVPIGNSSTAILSCAAS